jgi:hypothetical protein
MFSDPNIWTNLITALGVNVTIAQMFFEALKSKAKKK